MNYLENPRVYWNLTNKCNITPSCEYCYQESTSKFCEDKLNLQEKYGLINELYYSGIRLMGFGGGEPSLDKDLPFLIKYTSEKGIFTQMVSNGTTLNRSLVKKLYNGGLKQIGINLDSVDPKIHNSFRGGKDYWGKALQGVLNCLEAGLETGIVMTVSKRNFHEIEKYIQFGIKLNVSEIEFVNLVPVGKGEFLKNEMLSKNQLRKMFEISLKYYSKNKPVINIGDPQFYLFCNSYEDKKRSLGCGCAAGISTCTIQPDLTITPCLLMPKLIAGDLKKDSFEDIWNNSQVFKKLRDRNNLEGKCGSCNHNENCGGCMSMAYAITGNFMAENPFCVMD